VLDIKLRIFPKLGAAMPMRERALMFVHGLYYLHGLGTALNVALLTFMLVTGWVPAVFSVTTGRWVAVLWVPLYVCHLYRQKFFLKPDCERGVHWRAAFLRFAKWPHVLLALRDTLAGPNRGYALTPKVRVARRRYAAARIHLLVAGLVCVAWLVGTARGAPEAPIVLGGAALFVTLSLLVALSELRRFPSPYEDALASQELGPGAAGVTSYRARATALFESPADDPLRVDPDQRRRQGDRLASSADFDRSRTPRVRALEIVDHDRDPPAPGDVAKLL
jgi:hypothetical protein